MKVDQLIATIEKQPSNNTYEVVNGDGMVIGKGTVSNASAIRGIAASSAESVLQVKLFAPNGTSRKLRETYLLENVKQAVAPTLQLGNIGAGSDQATQYIINDLARKNNELSLENFSVKEKYEKLKDEHFDLKKELAFKDERHAIEKLKADATASSGISGIVDKVTSNDRLMEVLGTLGGAFAAKMMNAHPTGEEEEPAYGETKQLPSSNYAALMEVLTPVQKQHLETVLGYYLRVPVQITDTFNYLTQQTQQNAQ